MESAPPVATKCNPRACRAAASLRHDTRGSGNECTASALSFISDRTIGTKIAAGFAAVLLLLVVSSVFAWLSFGRVAGAMDEYATLVTNADIFQGVDLQVTQFRGQVREYIFSNDEATGATAAKEAEALRQFIATGLTKISNAERHRLLEDAAKQVEQYGANFEHIRTINLEQAKIESDVLDAVGQQMTDGTMHGRRCGQGRQRRSTAIGGRSAPASSWPG